MFDFLKRLTSPDPPKPNSSNSPPLPPPPPSELSPNIKFKIFDRQPTSELNTSFANFMNITTDQSNTPKNSKPKIPPPSIPSDIPDLNVGIEGIIAPPYPPPSSAGVKKKIFEPSSVISPPFLPSSQILLPPPPPPPPPPSLELKDVESHYFNENSEENLLKLELLKFPRNVNANLVVQRLDQLTSQSTVIAGLLSANARKNYEKFSEGLMCIDVISGKVEKTVDNIAFVRGYLKKLKEAHCKKGTEIMETLRRKQRLEKLLEFLIKFQKKFGVIYKKLNKIDEENGSLMAYELIPTIAKARAEFQEDKFLINKFACLRNMDQYLTGKLEEIKFHVKKSMQSVYKKFDEKKYYSLLKSYYNLEGKDSGFTPLIKQYPVFINENIKEIIKAIFECISKEFNLNLNIQNLGKFQASKMMFQIPKELYIPLMQRLFNELINFMYNSHLCCRFHENNESKLKESKEFSDYFYNLKMEYLANKKTIWQQIQKKLSKIINISNHITSFASNEILDFLIYSNKFVEIGEDFSLFSSKEIKTAVLNKCRSYFENFQDNHLINLKTILLSEEWKRLPLPKNYRHNPLLDLLKNFPTDTTKKIATLISNDQNNLKKIESLSIKDYSSQNNAFSSFVIGNPFDLKLDKNNKGAIFKQKNSYEKSNNIPTESFLPSSISFPSDVVVCSSSHNLVKGFENYAQMMDFLRPISFDVFSGLSRVLDYYIYAIINLFCPEPSRASLIYETTLSGLKNNLKEDENNISYLENQYDYVTFQTPYKNLKKYYIKICDMIENISNKFSSKKADFNLFINNNNSVTFYEFTERIIAIESLQFVFDYFNLMKPLFLKLNPDPKHYDYITGCYENYKSIYQELKIFVYSCYMPQILKNENIFATIPNLKWDTKDYLNEIANIYTERLVFFIKDQKDKLSYLGGGCVPIYSQREILILLVITCMKQLVEAYSKIKKCNTNGRQQMLSEFTQIVKGIEIIIENPKVPFKDYVEQYITVWNKKIEDITDFIINSKEYNLKFLMSLFHTSPPSSLLKKQAKKDLIAKIEKEYTDYLRNI